MLRAVRGRPRIDIVDAVEQGIVVYDDGFWKGVQAEYAKHPYGRSRHALIMIR